MITGFYLIVFFIVFLLVGALQAGDPVWRVLLEPTSLMVFAFLILAIIVDMYVKEATLDDFLTAVINSI